MFRETTESRSEADGLHQSPSEATTSSTATTSAGVSSATLATKANIRPNQQNYHPQHRDQGDDSPSKTSYSVTKQQAAATALHQRYLNYFNSKIPKEQATSQRSRGSIFAPNERPPHTNHPSTNQRASHNTGGNINNHSTYVYHIPSQIHHHNSNSHQQQAGQQGYSNMSRSVPRDESQMTQRFQNQQQNFQLQQQPPQSQQSHMKPRTHSTGTLYPISQQTHQFGPSRPTSGSSRLDQQQQLKLQQQDRDSEETTTTTIKEELENDLQGCKTSELEAISSLERNLPIELSFLIKQQAHCMARMNYLDRQIRELKEAAQSQQQVELNQVTSTSIPNQGHQHRPASNIVNAATTVAHTKNGNFILSDDSGGEYSRATMSDDDELSSLLDQIAKSVRPERGSGNSMPSNSYNHPQQQQQQPRLGTLVGNQNQQPHQQQTAQQFQQSYAIINPNQLHQQQAIPIFVMGSPIAVAHPPSINSNILPGVHFQPEPRYNQYYEDFYYGNHVNSSMASSMIATLTPAMQRQAQAQHPNALRSQQFDSSISAIEQLVSQKEKRQIISQLKSADNWLKMRASAHDSSLSMGNKPQQQQQQQQKHPLQKQLSAEVGMHEMEAQNGDNKTNLTATLSASTMQAGDDRVIGNQVND